MKDFKFTLMSDEYLGEDNVPHCQKCREPRYTIIGDNIIKRNCSCQQEAFKKKKQDVVNKSRFLIKEIKADEHADEKGLPICNNCGEHRYLELDDKVIRCQCKCQAEAFKQREFEEKLAKKQIQAQHKKSLSLLGKRYADATFENAEINDNNKKAFSIVRSYAEKYKTMLDKGYGFYVYGSNGTGKTHLIACLCNYLTDRLEDCIFTNFMNIANDIKKTYNSSESSDSVIDKYSKTHFLFIDDLGKESYKKLNGDIGWLDGQIFLIFNNRYNNMLPTIISSNYPMDELSTKLNIDSAVVDRISEMATRIIRLDGENRRRADKQNWD